MRNTIYSRFRYYVEKQPDSVAIIEDKRSVTYHELDKLADAIIAGFYDKHYGFIGIVMSHGIEMVAAMLAVLKSGAAYVPAEKSLPIDRRKYMMKTVGAELVIDDDYCRGVSPADAEYEDSSSPHSPAYVLFTSGTTGRPKGVVVENHSVVNYAQAFEDEFHTRPGDVMLQYSVCSFDIFVEEVFTTLLNGATLAIPPEEVISGGITTLMSFVERLGVTEISGFPYLLAEMNKLETLPKSLRLLISGGDVLRETYIDKIRHMGPVIYNTYGPSETTICSNYYRCDNSEPLADGTFPVGHPVNGVYVKVMDNKLKELPPGEVGEICIFGEGVSRGYIGNPPENRNFVTLGDGTRMYRSGDMGYILPDGNLAFLHRRDDQVMILGKRVEPEEVENVLNTCPCVERGIVRAFSDDFGLAYLVAYIVPLDKKECTLHNIKEYLKSELADFMLPEFFVEVNKIPVNRHGKVDMDALPIVMKEGGIND
ncbi:MAG: amino acid adenylation domain-containing protein [Candidatus Amulumruptor caecigallinarius]|nr:amino acid adenylation domain-containing protein [Candidatus Amulumruptor caecigallinarius]